VIDSPVFEAIEVWTRHDAIRGGVWLDCRTAAGATANVRLTCPLAGVLRVEMGPRRLEDRASELLALAGGPAEGVRVEAREGELILSAPLVRARISCSPWQLRVHDAGSATGPAPPLELTLGRQRQTDGLERLHVAWALEPDEPLFGLGGAPGALNRRGQAVAWGPGGAAAIPFLWSTRGYGLFVHSDDGVCFDLGQRTPDVAMAQTGDEQLDCFIILGPAPAAVLRRYAELTGPAQPPPAWAFGLCLTETGPGGREALIETCASLRARLVPSDAVRVDSASLGGSALELSRSDQRRLAGLVRELHSIGFHALLAVSPYIRMGTRLYAEGLRKGYLVGDGQGQAYLRARGATREALVDLTCAGARAWWQERLQRVLAAGLDGVLAGDAGDVPAEAAYHDGTPGRRLRSRYPLLYQATVRAAAGHRPVWAAAGRPGSQRLAVLWQPAGSDLSLALAGVPLWAQEAPGLAECEERKQFVRACEVAAFSPFAFVHGGTAAEFAALGRGLESIVREYARLRHRLVPYIYSSAVAGAQTGLPLVRPLVLSDPGDRTTWSLDGEYLLGEHLLVVPVSQLRGLAAVYLPRGQWVDYWTGAVHQGPGWVYCRAPLDRLPLLVRAGAIIPTRPLAHYTGERPDDPFILEVYPQASGSFVLADGGATHELALRVDGGRMELCVPALGVPVEAVLHGVLPPAAVTVDGQAVECSWGKGKARVSLGEGTLLVYQSEAAQP